MDLPPAAPTATVLPPLVVRRPRVQSAPIVFVSAHSGRDYPPEFLACARLDPLALRRSEDCFVDELFAAAPALGMPLLSANFPRAFCDANREKWELDPAMFDGPLPSWANTTSTRVGAGLGTIARVVGAGDPIYRRKLLWTEAAWRLEELWQPFHDALHGLIEATRTRFGACLVVDCHSMPSGVAAPRPACDAVLGDAHGTACSAHATRRAELALTGMNYIVRRNDPYAGGYITRNYGRPHLRVHALQLEISRRLYMNEATLEPSSNFATLQADMTSLMTAMAEHPEALALT